MDAAFFIPEGPACYRPTESTIGPWSPRHQHAGPPIALLGHALRTHEPGSNRVLGRITVEILGPVPLDPCEVRVQVLRPGKRVELLQAQYRVNGQPVLIAQAWRLESLPGHVPRVSDPFNPPPLPAVETTDFFPGVSYFPYGHAMEWRFAQGSYVDLGPAVVWARPRIPLIEGVPLHALEALLTMLDSANGVSAELDLQAWSFVPVDLTLNLHRLPQGPWVGMDARTVIDGGGIGTVHTTVFDAQGAVGRSLHTLFVRAQGRAGSA